MLYKLFYKVLNNVIYNFTFFLINTCKISIEINMLTNKLYNLGISNHVSELDVFILYVIFSCL